jgi:Mn-containing catalase
MEIIRRISEKIDEELHDAEKYIKCAYKVEDEYPQLADTYYQLSLEEMKHVTMLHDAVVRIINDYKQRNEVPREMQILYDYLHDRQVRWASKIKAKQEQFK